jgi:hypothetical protein
MHPAKSGGLFMSGRAALRTINPPLTEAEIMRERLALEEAVRRVEGEAAQRAGDAGVPSLRERVEISVEMPPMIVTGGATGGLSRILRWVGTSRTSRNLEASRRKNLSL